MPDMSAAQRQIAYLWVPAFGPTVARRAQPRLDGRPLVLLDEHNRVLAADLLAAQAGIATGLPERQAVARCPEAIVVPAANFPLWEAQEAFLERIKGYTDRWQPNGLGGVYLDATGIGRPAKDMARNAGGEAGHALVGWCQAVAGAVRSLGWQPILGATGSKFGANVVGLTAWQNAALLLVPAAQRAFLAGQPVTTLPMDLDALTQLRHLGIRTLGQYARLPATGVLARFGPEGRTAQRWAQGLDDRPVVPPWEAPEVAARIEFDPPLADRERLSAALARQAEKLLAPLRERLQAASRVLLVVVRADGRTVTAGHTLPVPAAAAEPVRLALAAALDRVAWNGQSAAEITLTLAGITDAPGRQLALFDFTTGHRTRLAATLDRLAARFGPDSFRLATLTDPDNLLPERRFGLSRWR